MATKKVITSIDSRMGKRGRRETFSFSGVEAQEHIDEYMEEVRMTRADLESYKTSAAESATTASAASTAAASASTAAGAAAASASTAAEAATKAADATDGVVDACKEAAEEASTAATAAGTSAESAQAAAEAAQKAADQAGAAVVGVASFNGRGGAVVPQAGDYTADMVGAISEEVLNSKISGVEEDLNTVGEDLTALNGKVTTLIGSDSGKSARTIALEELVKQLIPENAQASLDTLKEISEWIQSHPEEAAAMNEKIAALQTALTGKADKATTLSGYGITDAYTRSEVEANTVKTLSISGRTITVTFGDGSTATLTTQDTNTTYSNATTSAAGLMSASDKSKLNGIATGATNVTVDSALSSTSTNPVQNKAINTALSAKADTTTVTEIQTEVNARPSARKLATQTLTASGGTLTWTDNAIGDDSLIDVYASIPNIAPSEITQSGTTCTVTFDAQDEAFSVAIVVMY